MSHEYVSNRPVCHLFFVVTCFSSRHLFFVHFRGCSRVAGSIRGSYATLAGRVKCRLGLMRFKTAHARRLRWVFPRLGSRLKEVPG
jgi:hypothetical protein